jgi:hypothetical protein
MCDGRAVRPLFRPLGVDVNPLVVTGRLGEQVDLALGDFVPVADADLLTDAGCEICSARERPH